MAVVIPIDNRIGSQRSGECSALATAGRSGSVFGDHGCGDGKQSNILTRVQFLSGKLIKRTMFKN